MNIRWRLSATIQVQVFVDRNQEVLNQIYLFLLVFKNILTSFVATCQCLPFKYVLVVTMQRKSN